MISEEDYYADGRGVIVFETGNIFEGYFKKSEMTSGRFIYKREVDGVYEIYQGTMFNGSRQG